MKCVRKNNIHNKKALILIKTRKVPFMRELKHKYSHVSRNSHPHIPRCCRCMATLWKTPPLTLSTKMSTGLHIVTGARVASFVLSSVRWKQRWFCELDIVLCRDNAAAACIKWLTQLARVFFQRQIPRPPLAQKKCIHVRNNYAFFYTYFGAWSASYIICIQPRWCSQCYDTFLAQLHGVLLLWWIRNGYVLVLYLDSCFGSFDFCPEC
jgi:hypothetical protein